VAFIANGLRDAGPENNTYWAYLQQNLRDNNLDAGEVPVVIQFNKMDLPNSKTKEELDEVRQKGGEPVFPAVAVRGEGVIETLHGLLQATYRSLDRRMQLASRLSLSESQFLDGVFTGLDLTGTQLERAAPPPGGA
jgi:mutual gliding-motility protein MglA